jgi:hypothetical protein
MDATLPIAGFSEGGGALPTINDVNRAISANGATIMFLTAEPLQEDDVVGGSNKDCIQSALGCEVYEWHECVHANCSNGTAGEVGLISDGQDATGVEAAAMSETGADIVFQTRTQLVGQDKDELGDIYDARIDGGFPAPPAEPMCSPGACQGTATPAPAFEAPGTASFAGDGNLTPAPFRPIAQPEGNKPKTTKAQLRRAIAKCKKDRTKQKRVKCERTARTRYGAKEKAKGKM